MVLDAAEDPFHNDHHPNQHSATNLDFSSCKLYGREEELKRLWDVYRRVGYNHTNHDTADGHAVDEHATNNNIKITKPITIGEGGINDTNNEGTSLLLLSSSSNGMVETPLPLSSSTTATTTATKTTATTTPATTVIGTTKMEHESQLVLLGGYSGTGKTSLVRTFVEQIHQKTQRKNIPSLSSSMTSAMTNNNNKTHGEWKPCCFLHGKFDENQSAAVFMALTEAFNGYLTELMSNKDSTELHRVRDGIRQAIGEDGRALMGMFPELHKVMEEGSVSEASRGTSQCNRESKGFAWNRLAYAFQCFVRIISTNERPVVLFLDDLQWADIPSLDLITDLLLTNSTQHLMLIAAYRTNEVTDGHPLLKRLEKISERKSIERIPMENLSVDKIQELVADVLRLDVEEVTTLAEVIYSKTQGNIFFAIQLLEQLKRKNLLYKSMHTFKWTWDDARVAQESSISDNVVELVTAKIQSMPFNLQQTLMIASFLRTTFDTHVMAYMMQKEDCAVTDANTLVQILDDAVKEGLLDHASGEPESYRFAHDRIRHAAYALVPSSEELNHLRQRIGMHLLKLSLTARGEDWMLFVAVDHLNSIPNPKMDALEMARLNLNVGEQAIEVAALLPASKYLQRALLELQKIQDPWTTQYSLSLRLHRHAAEVELCLGNFEAGNALAQKVFQHAENFMDKLPTTVALADGLGRRERHADALDLNLQCLEMLGGMPRSNILFRVVACLMKVRKLLKKHSDYDIMLFSMMTDESKLTTMALLCTTALRAYHCGKMPLVLLCILKKIIYTFKYGVCPESCQGFASWGLILCGTFGDQEGANRMSRLSKSLLERTGSGIVGCEVLFTVAAFVDVWAVPIPQTLETLQKSFKMGMECGDTENVSQLKVESIFVNSMTIMRFVALPMSKAFRSWASSCTHAYVAGFPLEAIEASGKRLMEQLVQYRVDGILVMVQHFMMTVFSLSGTSEKDLEWDKFTEKPPRNMDSSETFRWIWYYWCRMQLSYHFGRLELAYTMIEGINNLF